MIERFIRIQISNWAITEIFDCIEADTIILLYVCFVLCVCNGLKRKRRRSLDGYWLMDQNQVKRFNVITYTVLVTWLRDVVYETKRMKWKCNSFCEQLAESNKINLNEIEIMVCLHFKRETNMNELFGQFCQQQQREQQQQQDLYWPSLIRFALDCHIIHGRSI